MTRPATRPSHGQRRGQTRLAVESCGRLATHFDGGVVFASMESLTRADGSENDEVARRAETARVATELGWAALDEGALTAAEAAGRALGVAEVMEP